MPKPRKIRRNAYLYQLLQWLVRTETDYFNSKMFDDMQIYNLFYRQALKDRALAFPDEKTEVRSKEAENYAKSFYKTVWHSHPDHEEPEYNGYAYTEDKLDELVTYIKLAGPFTSWQHFCTTFNKDDGAKRAEKVRDNPFFKLPQKLIKQISASAYKRYAQINYFLESTGKVSGETYNVLVDKTDSFIIRNANDNDIHQIERLAENIYPCSINGFELKKPWHAKNSNVFFVHLGEFENVHANINLLPIKVGCYEDLRSGKRYENTILADDIYNLTEKEKVNHIYVEGLASTCKAMLTHLALYLPKMIESIASPNNPRLVICAIGGSREGDALMKNHGFMKTGSSIDPADGTEYEFLETSWASLRLLVTDYEEHWRHEGKFSIVKQSVRLTKIPKH